MAQGRSITSPDGDRWQVRRRWSDRPLPRLRKSLRRSAENLDESGLGARSFEVWALDLSGGWLALAVGVLAALLVIALLPLLGVALELLILFALFSSGLVGRVLLGRPWIVEARDLDDGERSVAYAVKGFRRAGAAVAELESALVADGPPERLSAGGRTALPRPSRESIHARPH